MPNKRPFSLTSLHTFGLQASCAAFCSFTSREELTTALAQATCPPWILGGGSNVILPEYLERTVLHNQIPGIRVIAESPNHVQLAIGAGVIWHDLVAWTVSRGWGGIENLALIPGTVGAAPIQNIGAYGRELKEVFLHLEAVHIADRQTRIFTAEECQFGYRDSVFKGPERDQWVIVEVVLQLDKHPSLTLDYGAIRDTLQEWQRDQPQIRDVFEAVIHIRRSKLPDPAEIGNAGSFFKNPVIARSHYLELRKEWPDLPAYPAADGSVKVPAGWLIDRAGWKGHRRGPCGVHDRQALVLVNLGGASAEDILGLAFDIQQDIQKRFDISLEREVRLIES